MIFEHVNQALLYFMLFGAPPCSSDWHFCAATPAPYVDGVRYRDGDDRTPSFDAPAVSEPETDAPERCEG